MENQVTDSSEERTFQYQSSLPSLPVPALDESLRKYLDSGLKQTLMFIVGKDLSNMERITCFLSA